MAFESVEKSNLPYTMTIVLTLIFLILLELGGLYLASEFGQRIRLIFLNAKTKARSPRLRWLDVIIGYAAIFGIFGFIALCANALKLVL